MRERRHLGVPYTWHPTPRRSRSTSLRCSSLHLAVARDQGRRFLVVKLLAIGSASLAAALVASLAAEAFDADLALWPVGAEDFTVAAYASLPSDAILPLGCASFNLNRCLVMTAGAHLLLQHRARSDLATDTAIIPTSFNMAEPRRQNPNAAPVLGHFICWSTGENPCSVALKRRVASLTGGRR